MPVEIEERGSAEGGGIEVASVDQNLVVVSLGLGHDLAIGIDDQAAAKQRVAIFDAGLGDRDHPGRILVGARLHGQAVLAQGML